MNFLEKVGGTPNVILSGVLMVGVMLLIAFDKVTPEVGFGFITAALIPLALGYQANQNHQQQLAHAEQLSDEQKRHAVELTLAVAKKQNEVKSAIDNLGKGDSGSAS